MPAEKKWILKPAGNPEPVAQLARELDIAPRLANLLVQRVIDTYDKAQRFFNPKLENLNDPFLMKDMQRAVERIDKALCCGERIRVYGDYDVDGTTAVALVYSFLEKRGSRDLMFYIPDRYTEGYGISRRSIDLAAENGVKLMIALDCGIKANEKIDYAASKGIDFIVCDHHLPGDEIPNAVAVLDPKRADCNYPFKELSGCGVGFKMLQAYCQYKGLAAAEVESLMDLVVVSIASDIVPLVEENRILAYYGLKRLNEAPNRGLLSVIKLCGLEKHNITIDDIVFKIGPRINAAGRMEIDDEDDGTRHYSGGHRAVKLLIANTDEKAKKFGDFIDKSNADRKNIDRSITQEAAELIEKNPDIKNRKSTVIYNPNWVKGVVGIVASRLIERYYRPTVVLTMSNGFVTGSARSVAGFDLYQAVESCADLLENFGGHSYAAGLTMKPQNVEEFTRRFNKYVEEHIEDDMLIPQVEIDSELLFSDITPKFRNTLNRFQPFGPGNSAPVFITRSVSDSGEVRLVGNDCDHLKLELIQHEKPNTSIAAIAFQQPTHYSHIKLGGAIDVCYCVVENHYRGIVTPQLRVRDIKPVEK
ncbi:MAG: single-stranded-DNA-specific exonuclease RecJ [Rikenellaceae bacterium]|nr:single-stranded-DNA-specific exonuclease RecJ [Rikenellaceae bacterium]